MIIKDVHNITGAYVLVNVVLYFHAHIRSDSLIVDTIKVTESRVKFTTFFLQFWILVHF